MNKSVLLFFGVCLECITIVFIGFYLFKKLWLQKKRYIFIPTDKKMFPNQIQDIKIDDIQKGIVIFLKLLYKLDANYWISKCGFEAYTYLYYLRTIMMVLIIFILISFSINVPYAVIFLNQDWYSSFSMINHSFHANFQIFFVYVFAIIFLFSMLKMRYCLKIHMS